MQTRFQDDPDVYQSFVAILIMYRHKEKSSEEIAQMVWLCVIVCFYMFFLFFNSHFNFGLIFFSDFFTF